MPHRQSLAVWLMALLLGACGSAPAPTPTSTNTPGVGAPSSATGTASPEAVDNPRIQDLAYLVERLEALHPNPYLDEGEATFRGRVAAIEARAAELTDAGFLVAVMDLMGHRERDGHSGAWAMAQTGDNLHAWPVWLWDFPDGLRVVAAPASDHDLMGARLVGVGKATVDAARLAVEPLVPRDNDSSLRANLPMYLLLPEVLEELGLRGPGDPGLVFELAHGSTRELTTDPLPIEDYRDWVFGEWGGTFPESLRPDDDGPAYLRHRDLAFWSEVLVDPAGLYVGYNQVTRASAGRSITDLAAGIQDAAIAGPADEPFAIDLRNNGGGDHNTYRSLRDAVEAMARARPGRVSIITGRSTFSAAGNFVTELLVGPEREHLRLVGEPPGGGLNIYADVRVVTLPASGIVVLISTRYHVRAPGDDRLELTPDLPVEVTGADYAAGRDPVLEAAFAP